MQKENTKDSLTFTITLAQHRPDSSRKVEAGEEETLSEGASFWDVESDLQPIYENFNILSYLSPSVGVQLIDSKRVSQGEEQVQAFKFRLGDGKQPITYVFEEKQKFQMIGEGGKKELVIRYYFFTGFEESKQKTWPFANFKDFKQEQKNEKNSQINTEKKIIIQSSQRNILGKDHQKSRKTRIKKKQINRGEEPQSESISIKKEPQNQSVSYKNIIITIEDCDKWIQDNVLPEHRNNRNKFGRISEKRSAIRRRNYTKEQKTKAQQEGLDQLPARFKLPKFSKDLQYFYMEPQSRRKKMIENRHIALALRGGGCKGIAYIGAYRAILHNFRIFGHEQEYQRMNTQAQNAETQVIRITSIIGSSSGALIGLAACCQIHPDIITRLCEQHLSMVAQDRTDSNRTREQNEQCVRRYVRILREVILQYNVADEHLVDSLGKILSQEAFVDYLYRLVKSSVGFAGNETLDKLFYTYGIHGEILQRNYCSLFGGNFMTGARIQIICRQILNTLINNPRFYAQNRDLFADLKGKKEWEQKMTMKDLYEITGVEFTCTSVDITNHILRFFNHKTTPNLPVIKAVKMSSAYPIAFEPTYWDKNWGKYYIHYENIRREVDLEGCKFTDGGMLANFPIDFIDNQEMRPMYFSHYKDAQTIMYGVGLSECGQTSTTQTSEKDPLSSWEKLKCMGKMNAMKLGLQYLGINSPKTKQIDVTEIDPLQRLRKIPLFDFGFNLLLTYSSTKDKLAKQAFRHLIYEIQPSQTVTEYLKDRDNSNKNIFNDLQKLRNTVTQIINTGRNASEVDVLIQNLEYLMYQNKEVSTEHEILQLQEKLDIILENLIFNFLKFFNEQEEIRSLLLERVRQTFDQNRVLATSYILGQFQRFRDFLKYIFMSLDDFIRFYLTSQNYQKFEYIALKLRDQDKKVRIHSFQNQSLNSQFQTKSSLRNNLGFYISIHQKNWY